MKHSGNSPSVGIAEVLYSLSDSDADEIFLISRAFGPEVLSGHQMLTVFISVAAMIPLVVCRLWRARWHLDVISPQMRAVAVSTGWIRSAKRQGIIYHTAALIAIYEQWPFFAGSIPIHEFNKCACLRRIKDYACRLALTAKLNPGILNAASILLPMLVQSNQSNTATQRQCLSAQ